MYNKRDRLFPGSAISTTILAEENLGKGDAKVGREDGVNNRVEKRVQVAGPGENGDKTRALEELRQIAIAAY